MLKKHLVIMALLLILGALNATLLLEDNFTGTVGSLLTVNGWTNHSGTSNYIPISGTDLTYAGYQSSGGGSASLLTTGEDVNRAYATQTADVYFSFLVNVTAAQTVGDYFAHLGASTLGSTFFTRICAKKVDATTNAVYFGLGKLNEAAQYFTTTSFPYNTTVLIVARMSPVVGTTNDIVSIWINPTLGATAPTPDLSFTFANTDPADIGRMCLRQGTAANAPTALVDGIRVGTEWQDCGGLATGNVAPNITNIIRIPEFDVESTDTVSIQADVTDSDGTVALVRLFWGTTPGSLTNSIDMENAFDNTYQTSADIPAQINGTTIYYKIYAEDDDTGVTNSSEMNYTVRDPATTTIPYTESFTGTFGYTYAYSVAGNNAWYLYAVNDAVSCNGYGLTLAEDWLVLPGINFNAYSSERMTFNTLATFGAIDANNYLKFYYSSNYHGIGNPTTATWTEIPFTAATVGGAETSSGVLNLSGITGTNVYLAFKYYSTDLPTRWEVDDINIYLATTPTMLVTPETLSGFTYPLGSGPSGEQTFTVSGADLTGNIILNAPADYEVSLSSGGGFTNTLTLTQDGGIVNSTTIHVNLKAGLAIGTYNTENITVETTDAMTINVVCSGEVTTPPAPGAPVADAATNVTTSGFSANWQSSAGATKYYLDVYSATSGTATGLFFSEYIEGLSNNKAIEIFNGTGSPVDLTDYQFENWFNGGSVPNIIPLTTTLANGDVYVLAHTLADAAILAVADQTNSNANFNGDDALVLRKISTDTIVDIFGRMTEDPGTFWGTIPITTQDHTLRRLTSVLGGITTNPDAGFPTLTTEWECLAVNTFDNLGTHSVSQLNYVPGYENLDVNNVLTYPVADLTNNTTYYYVVRAYNTYGTSPNSNQITVFTTGGTVGIPIVIITEASGTIHLNWETVAGATSYRIEHSVEPYAGYTTLGSTTNLTYPITSAAKKWFRVFTVQ